MTNQQVINFLNQARKILLDDKSWIESAIKPINEAFDMAISALEKQIQKKPIMAQNRYGKKLWHLECPHCGNHIGMRDSRLMREDIYNNANKIYVCIVVRRLIGRVNDGRA